MRGMSLLSCPHSVSGSQAGETLSWEPWTQKRRRSWLGASADPRFPGPGWPGPLTLQGLPADAGCCGAACPGLCSPISWDPPSKALRSWSHEHRQMADALRSRRDSEMPAHTSPAE